MLRILATLFMLLCLTGCTINEEKTLFQLAGLSPEEISRVKIARAGKTIELSDVRAASLLLQPMADAAPAPDAGKTRIGPAGEDDYTIDIFRAGGAAPVRFYYNSEKQWLYFTRGKKTVHPYKCEPLLEPLSQLFKINSFKAVLKEKEGLPRYFSATGWFENNSFYGLRGNQFTIWDPEKGTTELLLPDVWQILIAPDRKKLAYTNSKGLNIFDFTTLQSETVVEADKFSELAAPVCWSPDSARLIYAVEHEWHSDFFILELASRASGPFVFQNVDNFLSKPVAWLRNGNTIFIVSSAKSRDGRREYMSAGYRSDLMEADPRGIFRKITRMVDHRHISFAGLTEDEKEALVLIREKNLEYRTAIVDLADGDLEYLSWQGDRITAGISPDGRFVAAAFSLPGEPAGYRLELLDRYTKEIIFEYENPAGTTPEGFFWHPGGRKFFFMEKCLENTANNMLMVVKVLPA